jgi:hypothetical protein
MRVYYTGDMANSPGWFDVTGADNYGVNRLEEDKGEGRTFHVSPSQVGNVYHGHCNPRFVTEVAYKAFHAARRMA